MSFFIILLIVLIIGFVSIRFTDFKNSEYRKSRFWKFIFYITLGFFGLLNFWKHVIDFDAIVTFIVFVEVVDNLFEYLKESKNERTPFWKFW